MLDDPLAMSTGTSTCWARCCIKRTATVTGTRTSRQCRTRFDNYQGSINGFSSALNPIPSPQHLLSAHVRLELASLLKAPQTAGIALVVNGDNMTNESRWLPDWGANTGDTIPVRRGRTLYVGVETSMGRRPTTRTSESN